jgi:hypothetical protein
MGFLAGVVGHPAEQAVAADGWERGGSHAVSKSQVGGGSPTRR